MRTHRYCIPVRLPRLDGMVPLSTLSSRRLRSHAGGARQRSAVAVATFSGAHAQLLQDAAAARGSVECAVVSGVPSRSCAPPIFVYPRCSVGGVVEVAQSTTHSGAVVHATSEPWRRQAGRQRRTGGRQAGRLWRTGGRRTRRLGRTGQRSIKWGGGGLWRLGRLGRRRFWSGNGLRAAVRRQRQQQGQQERPASGRHGACVDQQPGGGAVR